MCCETKEEGITDAGAFSLSLKEQIGVNQLKKGREEDVYRLRYHQRMVRNSGA